MIRLTGRVMQGLDEFMLRLGHLKVVCNLAIESSTSRFRLEREAAEHLTQLVEVPSDDNSSLAIYLDRKKLCPGEDNSNRDSKEYRYPDLRVLHPSDHNPVVQSVTGMPVRVWWQDLCFASTEVPSKVGTITTSSRAGGKTGLSHIFDWAELCDLISKTGQLSIAARLLPKLGRQTAGVRWIKNPYVLGNEKIILAFSILQEDFDIFSRLLVALSRATFPLKRRQAMELFAGVVESLVLESESARYLSSRQQFQIGELARDLAQAARRSRLSISAHSTTWHRVSSRLESFVDFGLLSKGRSHSYEYTYSPTDTLYSTAQSLIVCDDPSKWFESRFCESILGRGSNSEHINVEPYLASLLEILSNPQFGLHIDSLILGIVSLAADAGVFVSIEQCRRDLERFARERPDRARLARGTSGERAEFINFFKVAKDIGNRDLIH